MVAKVLAKSLSYTVVCPYRALLEIAFGYRPPETEEMKAGEELHRRLGFDNEITFSKDIEIYTIIGKPDKIGDEIQELKTTRHYSRKDIPEHVIEQATTQLGIYLWLTGRVKGRLFIYSMTRDAFIYECKVLPLSDDDIIKLLDKAFRGQQTKNSDVCEKCYLNPICKNRSLVSYCVWT